MTFLCFFHRIQKCFKSVFNFQINYHYQRNLIHKFLLNKTDELKLLVRKGVNESVV